MSDLQKLTPFKFFALTNFPFIEADFDALTNYQLMCKIAEYINQIADRQNETIDAFNDLETDFTQLQVAWNTYKTTIDYKIAQFQAWFDNLDVQEEINEKLDQMAQDGTLSDLVAPFIPSVVTAWLNEHITQPTNPVVDSSLTVSGAAADAKVTGDRITDVNTALKEYLHEYGIVITNNNYQSLGITSVKDIPNNTAIVFGNTVTAEMIPDLPIYGVSCTIYKINATDTSVRYFAFGNVNDKVEIYTRTGVSTEWVQLPEDDTYVKEYGIAISSSNYQTLGITSVTDIPKNTLIVFTGNITQAMVPDLPLYNVSVTVYKLNATDSSVRYFAIGTNAYGGLSIYTRTDVAPEWILLNPMFRPNRGVPIYFTVPVNQNDYNIASTDKTVLDTETISNVNCCLVLPESYNINPLTPTQLVFCPHGASGSVSASEWSSLTTNQFLLDAGYAVFDINGSTAYSEESGMKGENLGSPRTIQAAIKALNFIQKYYNVDKKIFIKGSSMGGLTALNFCNAFPEYVKAVALLYPITDLYNQAWLHPWTSGTKTKLASEYFFDSASTYDTDKTVGYNPALNKSYKIDNDDALILPMPIKIWHGMADDVSDYQYSVNYINKLKKGNCICSLRLIADAGHHRADFGDCFTTGCVSWFKRFHR